MNQRTAILKAFFASISVAMIVVTIKTSLQSNLFDVLPGMIRDPWTLATFIDFYFNILVIFTWVVYKENSVIKSAIWLVAFLALGSIATAAYVFWQLRQLKPGEPPQRILLRQEDLA